MNIWGFMSEPLNRRDFLKAAAIAAGPVVISARGANDKINIGWIGVGTRGYAAPDWLHTAAPNDVRITAICDTYQGYIDRAQDRMKTIWGNTPKVYADYRELLADPSIYEYPDNFQIDYSCYFGNDRYGYGEQICGNEGTIKVMNREDLYFTPESFKGKPSDAVKSRGSILGDEKPIAPPAIGRHAAISGHMATVSFKNQKNVIWDEAAGNVHFA
jgi:hypothetical protein